MTTGSDFKKHIAGFEKKLESVSIENITAALYIRQYLRHLLDNKKYYLTIYADVLDKLTRKAAGNRSAISLIDFGSGNGLLGLFAKYCGFKKVYLNDIDPKFIRASEKLAQYMDIAIDGYITGDIGSAKTYFNNEKPDAIIGTDVIEHIYSLEDFLAAIHLINPSMVSVFTTASNPGNYYKVWRLRKMQLKDELVGGAPGDHIFFGEKASLPYVTIRQQIIQKLGTGLTSQNVADLAKFTRGLREDDIIKAIGKFRATGKLPAIPAIGTNTCDPVSGNWTERVLPFKAYTFLYRSNGFDCLFYKGFYNTHQGGFKGLLKKIFNALIPITGYKVAPYIGIVGFPRKK